MGRKNKFAKNLSLLIILLIVQSVAFAQCPVKKDYKVSVQDKPQNQLEIKAAGQNKLSFEFKLIDVNKGPVDIFRSGITEINEPTGRIFRNLPPGEYIIMISSTDCKIYLDADNRGSGFVISE